MSIFMGVDIILPAHSSLYPSPALWSALSSPGKQRFTHLLGLGQLRCRRDPPRLCLRNALCDWV